MKNKKRSIVLKDKVHNIYDFFLYFFLETWNHKLTRTDNLHCGSTVDHCFSSASVAISLFTDYRRKNSHKEYKLQWWATVKLTSNKTNTKLTLSAATLGCSLIYNESAQQEALQIFNLAGFYTGCPSWRNSKEMCISSWDQAWDFLLVKQMCKLLHYGAKGAFDQAWNAMLLPAGVSNLTI